MKNAIRIGGTISPAAIQSLFDQVLMSGFVDGVTGHAREKRVSALLDFAEMQHAIRTATLQVLLDFAVHLRLCFVEQVLDKSLLYFSAIHDVSSSEVAGQNSPEFD